MNRLVSFLLFYLFALNVSAQEMWGFSNSNFSGNMGIHLNPSTIVAAPYRYEYHFLAVDIFAQDTYIYIPFKANLILRAVKGTAGNKKNFYDIYNGKLQSGFGHVTVIGPSYIQNLGKEAWGFHTAIRNEVSATKVPPIISKYIYERYDYKPFVNNSYTTEPFAVAAMSFAEIGGTYGSVLIDKTDSHLKWAATLNLLSGFNGVYLDGRNLDYTIYDSSRAVIHSMDATMAHSLQEDGSTGFSNIVKIRGIGMSTTLGVTYVHGRRYGAYDCAPAADGLKKYDYRIGASLMDFGFIHFGNQAQILEMKATSDRTWERLDTAKFHSFGHLDSLWSSHLYGIPLAVVNQSFNMYLPSAFSIQFDYSFTPHIYANVSWVNRIYFSPQQVARGNQLNFSLRYERRSFEVAADATLFEYNVPSFGVAVRYGYLVVGTDRLFEFLSLYDVKSFDLFFGLRWNFCEIKHKSKTFCPAYK